MAETNNKTKIKTLDLEQFKRKYSDDVIQHFCYIEPREEENCGEAIDLINATCEIFDNYYSANEIPVEDCASYFRKIAIHRKNYARVEPETIIDLIKDYFEDSPYNFDGEISEYLEGFEHIETAVELFNQAQTTYLCGEEICYLDLEEEFYRYIHKGEV